MSKERSEMQLVEGEQFTSVDNLSGQKYQKKYIKCIMTGCFFGGFVPMGDYVDVSIYEKIIVSCTKEKAYAYKINDWTDRELIEVDLDALKRKHKGFSWFAIDEEKA